MSVEALPISRIIDGERWRMEKKKDRDVDALLVLKRGKSLKLQLSSGIVGAVAFMESLLRRMAAQELAEEELHATCRR